MVASIGKIASPAQGVGYKAAGATRKSRDFDLGM